MIWKKSCKNILKYFPSQMSQKLFDHFYFSKTAQSLSQHRAESDHLLWATAFMLEELCCILTQQEMTITLDVSSSSCQLPSWLTALGSMYSPIHHQRVWMTDNKNRWFIAGMLSVLTLSYGRHGILRLRLVYFRLRKTYSIKRAAFILLDRYLILIFSRQRGPEIKFFIVSWSLNE